MKWLALAIVLLFASSASAMNCQLAADIAEASERRVDFLVGLREKVTGEVEKATLKAEIFALLDLKNEAIQWQWENCKD
jgi:hypothetical protein